MVLYRQTKAVQYLKRRLYSTNSPLDHIKVLDLSRIVAGPFCTMLLGDLGAEVFKVEVPGVGDETRLWPPHVNYNKDEMTCYFGALNRNKKSICVNFKSKKGVEIIHKLAEKCDVLVENFVPGKLDSIGLGYEAINKTAPHIVYCSITGFGPRGPYKERMGYDIVAASVGGLFHITGPKGGDPCKTGVAITDLSTGLYAHGAILAALLQRAKTGKGQKVDCNLLSTQVACLINIGSNYLNAGKEAVRWGTEHESIVVFQSFKTCDGYITITTGNDSQFKTLCERFSIDLHKDEKFKTNAQRVKNRDELSAILDPIFLKHTNEEVLKLLDGAPLPFGPVNTMKQVFEDPHIKEIGLVTEKVLANGTKFRMVGPPVEFSDSCLSVRYPPPDKGQHTREILTEELKMSNSYIDNLYNENVIQ
ncbi:succinate--hydroxymethylglutarate CoA-transferase [Cimex lectularius]|uniref:Uncharacterized protein n=1 Tax=Cimex lectularius TaxID=79782 RepID=A0A8I6SF10_CIMLE|nr:succinate--hydroxymethylglutarate CoA-transferase [Cimex lectularius]